MSHLELTDKMVDHMVSDVMAWVETECQGQSDKRVGLLLEIREKKSYKDNLLLDERVITRLISVGILVNEMIESAKKEASNRIYIKTSFLAPNAPYLLILKGIIHKETYKGKTIEPVVLNVLTQYVTRLEQPVKNHHPAPKSGL